MDTIEQSLKDRVPFLNGRIKRMLIGGTWVDAVSGKTFESRNPATGALLATVTVTVIAG